MSNGCYNAEYQKFLFECRGQTLYLNITADVRSSLPMTYNVTKIDYWNQTLSLVPQDSCSTFDPNMFGGLNITNTSILILSCPAQMGPRCTLLGFDVCGYKEPGAVWYTCEMTLDNFRDAAFNTCRLHRRELFVYSPRYSLVLQFESNRCTFVACSVFLSSICKFTSTWFAHVLIMLVSEDCKEF